MLGSTNVYSLINYHTLINYLANLFIILNKFLIRNTGIAPVYTAKSCTRYPLHTPLTIFLKAVDFPLYTCAKLLPHLYRKCYYSKLFDQLLHLLLQPINSPFSY